MRRRSFAEAGKGSLASLEYNERGELSQIRCADRPLLGDDRKLCGFDGPADQILLEHTARSREGFALGAIMAAEWIVRKTGFYEFSDVMDEILAEPPA